MKRILAILLAISLVLGCGITALASGSQTLLFEDFGAGVLPDGWTV